MFHLTIVTAEKTTYEGSIIMLTAPAVDGEIGILTDHHPIVTKLEAGALKVVYPDKREEILYISGGYLEVNNNKAIVLADMIENIDEIQVEEARAARLSAQERLKNAKDDVEKDKLEAEIHAHMIRERLADIAQYSKKRL
jgi:F-type H+-transporting ATPase subunit epsilon